MKQTFLSCGLLFICLASACTSPANANAQDANLAVKPPDSQPAKAVATPDQEMQKQIEQIAAAAKGHVGAEAFLLETGETVSLNPQDHFPMQSVYKLPIGVCVLQQVDAGKLKLEQKVRVEKKDFVRQGQASPFRDAHPAGADSTVSELLRLMLGQSDGTASDVLLALAGGPEAIQASLNELKVDGMVILNSEKEFGRDQTLQYQNWASPDASIALVRALSERRNLSEQSQTLLLKLMTESTTGPKRLKGLLPAGTVVAHKTGTSGTVKGVTAATNDIGLVTLPNGHHFAIAVFVSDASADEATREEVIAKIARAVWDKWSK